MSKKPKTAAEQLKKKLYKTRYSENFKEEKEDFDSKEFVKLAKEVRKTFEDEGNNLSPNSNI